METSAIISLAAILTVALFAALGAWRGLLRTVAGFLIMIAALMGAGYVASTYSQPLAESIAPVITETIASQMSDALSEQNLPDLVVGQPEIDTGGEMNELLQGTPFGSLNFGSLNSILEKVGSQNPVMEKLTEQIWTRLNSMRASFIGTASEAMTAALTGLLNRAAYGVLYALSYIVISMILTILMKFADPIIKSIPVIGNINTIGGGVIGLVEGLIIVCLALWVLEHFDIIAPGAVTDTVSMLMEKIPMDRLPFFASAPGTES